MSPCVAGHWGTYWGTSSNLTLLFTLGTVGGSCALLVLLGCRTPWQYLAVSRTHMSLMSCLHLQRQDAASIKQSAPKAPMSPLGEQVMSAKFGATYNYPVNGIRRHRDAIDWFIKGLTSQEREPQGQQGGQLVELRLPPPSETLGPPSPRLRPS
jgi:hypothetical protein